MNNSINILLVNSNLHANINMLYLAIRYEDINILMFLLVLGFNILDSLNTSSQKPAHIWKVITGHS